MEDGHRIVDPLPIRRWNTGKNIDAKWAYFAVYDGHGGRQAVEWLEEHLHHLVATELQTVKIAKSGHPEDSCVIAALTQAFKKVDAQLATLGAWKYGSTATVALMHTSFAGSVIYLANVGDSHAALVGGRHARIVSIDHKPSNPMEAARVQNEGGLVFRKRVGGILSVSRALGDHQLKGECGGVSCEPDVSICHVSDECRALVIASDGLWDVLSAADVQRIVQDSIERAVEKKGNPTQVQDCLSNEASQALVDAALKQGTHDNVIALVAFL
jgi:serine/threonine protein phosphatase PrpC